MLWVVLDSTREQIIVPGRSYACFRRVLGESTTKSNVTMALMLSLEKP